MDVSFNNFKKFFLCVLHVKLYNENSGLYLKFNNPYNVYKLNC